MHAEEGEGCTLRRGEGCTRKRWLGGGGERLGDGCGAWLQAASRVEPSRPPWPLF